MLPICGFWGGEEKKKETLYGCFNHVEAIKIVQRGPQCQTYYPIHIFLSLLLFYYSNRSLFFIAKTKNNCGLHDWISSGRLLKLINIMLNYIATLHKLYPLHSFLCCTNRLDMRTEDYIPCKVTSIMICAWIR